MTYEHKDALTLAKEALMRNDTHTFNAITTFAQAMSKLSPPRPIQNPQTFKDKGVDL